MEESHIRQGLKTSKGCPITELYLSVGQHPAQFNIKKMRLLYLKYILHEEETILISKFFYLHFDQLTKGEWVSTCLYDLKQLHIDMTLEDIKLISE